MLLQLLEYELAGTALIHLPFPVVDILSVVLDADLSDAPAPGVLASADDDLTARDPLAALEAQFVADDLAEALTSARREAGEQVRRILSAPAGDGSLTVRLNGDQLLAFSNWANSMYVNGRVQGGTDRVIGQEQDVFADADLSELTGAAPEAGEPEEHIALPWVVLAVLSMELVQVHQALQGRIEPAL